MPCKTFKSETYSSKVLQSLYDLWQSESFCDVEICCEGEIFKAHRTVLASSSTYFRAMFTVGMAEKEKSQVELKNVSSSTFSNLLSFIYTGQIFLSASTVQEILTAADMIGLPEVVESCTEYLKNELHPTNAIGIYRFAEGHNCKNLEKSALSYVYRHFPEVCETEEFLEAPKFVVTHFLESEKLKIDSEFQVLSAALRWLIYDLQNRKPHVFEILSKIRMLLIPSKLLEGCTEKLKDSSLQVALKSMQKDLTLKRGSLVSLISQPRKSAKKHIFLIGGSRKELGSGWKQLSESTLHSVACLDTFQKTWTDMAPMSIERILPGVAALEGLIYVIGGEQESKILANGEVYNPQDDIWTPIESMVIPRCAFGLTAFKNYLFAFGGWVGEDIGGSIERYDPYSNEWTMIGSMEEPKFSMGICSHEGLIYVLGGCTHQTRHLKDLLTFNPVTTEWETLSPLRVPRSQMGVAVLDGFLYAIGGSSKHAEVLKSVERYSFEEDRWTEVANMKVGRANPAVGAVDGKIYCIGGDQTVEQNFFRAQVTLSSVEVYDPLTDTWEDCEDIKESRSEAGYVVI